MTIQEIKKELVDMSAIADKNRTTKEDNFSRGYYFGYKKAISDLQRFIQNTEYKEKMEALYGKEE